MARFARRGIFLLRRRVPIRRGTHLFSAGYPALRRDGVTDIGFSRGRTQRPVPVPPNDTMTLDVPAFARVHLGLPGFRRKGARDPRALESTFSEVCRSKQLL